MFRLNIFSLLIKISLVSLVSSCSLAPVYQRPSLPIADSYNATEVASANATSEIDFSLLSWNRFFVEPKLQKLIKLALQKNRDIRLSLLKIEQLQARYGIVGSEQLPKINGILQSNHANDTTTNYRIGVGVMAYELDFFGRIASMKQSAWAKYVASREDVKMVQISLLTQIASAYLQWSADVELFNITQSSLDNYQQATKLNKQKFNKGLIAEIELMRSQSQTIAAQAKLISLKRQIKQDKNQLQLLVGQQLPAELTEPLVFNQQKKFLAQVQANLPSIALVQRPDVLEAEQQLIAANADIGAARAAFFPRISLTANAGKVSTELTDLLSGTTGWNFVPSIELPIFNAGANKARLNQAQIAKQINVVKYEKTIQQAFYEVSNALVGQSSWQQQLQTALQQQQLLTTTYQAASLSYANGLLNQLELLDAQRGLFAAQQQAVQVELAELINRITLYKALGGGWRNTDNLYTQI